MSVPRRVPHATVARLPEYLRILVGLAHERHQTVSSGRLAELGGFNAAKVRKDLSYLGSYGTRGVGYEVAVLLEQVREALGLTAARGVVVVGAGNLGRALANYSGFEERGFPVRALVDADPGKVGARVGHVEVRHADELPRLVGELGLRIGVIAVPSATAQDAADRLVAAGLHALLNFAPSLVNAPAGVAMRHVDLALELEVLSFYERQLGTVAPSVESTG